MGRLKRGDETDMKVIKIEKEAIDDTLLAQAARCIQDGGLVAFPTETVYGLGANALNREAARKIYAAKGRPSDNPLIVHIGHVEELKSLVREVPEAGKKLMETYWPGPLTLIFPKNDEVPDETTGGLDTVAVRMPEDPIAIRLIEMAGVPIAAPSANTSGRPSPTTAEHVYQDMNGRIDMLIDGGPVGIGVESTIVDVSGPVPVLLRPGAVTMEMLHETVGNVETDQAVLGPVSAGTKPKAPGMKYRHYAPKAQMVLVEAGEGARETVTERINRLAGEKMDQGFCVGIICTEETALQYPRGIVKSLGVRAQEETIAHNLFAVLREFDDLQADYIFSECFSTSHLGQAIMNRLSKAAGYHVVRTGEKPE